VEVEVVADCWRTDIALADITGWIGWHAGAGYFGIGRRDNCHNGPYAVLPKLHF
jgi:hypothetical protein